MVSEKPRFCPVVPSAEQVRRVALEGVLKGLRRLPVVRPFKRAWAGVPFGADGSSRCCPAVDREETAVVCLIT
jgi:hypothetical protein